MSQCKSLEGKSLKELRQLLTRKQLEAQIALVEASSGHWDNWVDPREPLTDDGEFWQPLGWEGENLPTNLDNRGKGEVLPVYISEMGLKRIRDGSRRLRQYNEFAINAIENRISYIVGNGFGYKIQGKPEHEDSPLIPQAQAVIDEFISRSNWAELEQEIIGRCDEDGEAFLRFFVDAHGRADVRIVEPEHVRDNGSLSLKPEDPQDISVQGEQYRTQFGIVTEPQDVESVIGYMVVEDPEYSLNTTFVAEKEIVHIKSNVKRTAKRGLPILLPVRKNLERAEKLLRNMSVLAQVQATFAMIRKHKQFSGSAVDAFRDAVADLSSNDPVSGKTSYRKRYLPGTILDVPENTDYEFPSSGVNAGAFVQILQADLRAVAARLVMPEYMLTVDASNANYSSTMIAESPSTKNFQRWQNFFALRFGDGAYGETNKHVGVMWRVLRIAVEQGKLPAEVLQLLIIKVEPPSLVVRDKAQETNRASSLNQAGLLSKATWAQWEGLDFEQEKSNLEQEQPEEPAQGAGGGDGQDLQGASQEDDPFAGLFGESLLEEEDGDGGSSEERFRRIAEILVHLYGEKALTLFDEGQEEDDEREQESQMESLIESFTFDLFEAAAKKIKFTGEKPDKNGRMLYFVDGKLTSRHRYVELGHEPKTAAKEKKKGKPKQSPEEKVKAAHDAVKEILTGGNREGAMQELAGHLGGLTIKQLDALKKEHGIRVSGKKKEELVTKLSERLVAKYHEVQAEKTEKPKRTSMPKTKKEEQPTPEPSPQEKEPEQQRLKLGSEDITNYMTDIESAVKDGVSQATDPAERATLLTQATAKVLTQIGSLKDRLDLDSFRELVSQATQVLSRLATEPEKKETEKKPEPVQEPKKREAEVHNGVLKAYEHLRRFKEYQSGMVETHRLYDEVQRHVPDVTVKEFHDMLYQMAKEKKLDLHVRNEVKQLSPDQRDKTLFHNDKAMGFIYHPELSRGNASAEQLFKKVEESWSHTGLTEDGVTKDITDKLGRVIHFVNGERVAKPSAKGPGSRGHKTKQAVALLGRAGARIASSAAAVVKDRISALTSKVPESVRAPLANTWHAVHGLLMSLNHGAQSMAAEVAEAKGLDEGQRERLGKTLAAIDLATQGVAYGALGASLTIPGLQGLAIPAKAMTYVPVGSMAYLLHSAVKSPVSFFTGAAQAIKKHLPGAIMGAAGHLYQSLRHPLTVAHTHESEGYTPELAGTIADRLQGGDHEWWLAVFHVALDVAKGDIQKAIDIADMVVEQESAPTEEGEGEVQESVIDLLEGFTGVITDSKGRKYNYVNGIRVKSPEHDEHDFYRIADKIAFAYSKMSDKEKVALLKAVAAEVKDYHEWQHGDDFTNTLPQDNEEYKKQEKKALSFKKAAHVYLESSRDKSIHEQLTDLHDQWQKSGVKVEHLWETWTAALAGTVLQSHGESHGYDTKEDLGVLFGKKYKGMTLLLDAKHDASLGDGYYDKRGRTKDNKKEDIENTPNAVAAQLVFSQDGGVYLHFGLHAGNSAQAKHYGTASIEEVEKNGLVKGDEKPIPFIRLDSKEEPIYSLGQLLHRPEVAERLAGQVQRALQAVLKRRDEVAKIQNITEKNMKAYSQSEGERAVKTHPEGVQHAMASNVEFLGATLEKVDTESMDAEQKAAYRATLQAALARLG